MESFINALSTGPLSVSVLMMLVILLVGFYVTYVIPKFKAYEDSKIAHIERVKQIEQLEKELRRANTLIKDYVESNALNESLSKSMVEVLNVCRETYQVVAQQFRSTEDDIAEVASNLNKAIDAISSMDKDISRDTNEKFGKVDTELRFLSSQLMNIHQRLASIIGIIVGGPARNMDSLFGFEEKDLK